MILVMISLVVFLSQPAIVSAQTTKGVDFFTEPLSLSRGKISPASRDAKVIKKEVYCDVVTKDWGWANCEGLDAFIVLFTSDVDTLIVRRPNSEGYVSFDDWKSGNLTDEIKAIERSLKESLLEQGKRLNENVEFSGWRVFPTLDERLKVMYYAVDIKWGNEVTTNIKASLFDRTGYVTFLVTPQSATLPREKLEKVIRETISYYSPNPAQSYTEFRTGDKVAAVGAIGVLASLLGVKYGQTAIATAIGVATLFLKKMWFLLLLPFLAIGRLFRWLRGRE